MIHLRLISVLCNLLFLGSVFASDLQINYTKTDISCFGKIDGKVDVFISGGIAPYALYFNETITDVRSFNGLARGNYTIKVIDAERNERSILISIEMPKPISVTFGSEISTSVDNFNSRMNIDISGGRPMEGINSMDVYMIQIDTTVNGTGNLEVKPGDHQLTIIDGSGCSISVPTIIVIESFSKKKTKTELPRFSEKGIIQMVFFGSKKAKFNHYEAFKNV